jgi:pyruvate,water dikinase
VRDQLDGGLDARADETLARQRETVANQARDILGGADLLRFERVLERALAAYPVREDNEFFTVSAPLGLLRRTALELGNRLADRGQITAAEDIFFVHVDEARTVLADGTDALHIVARHKGEHGWVVAHPGPASYGRDPGPPPPMRGLPDEARLANEAFLWAVDRILAPDAHGGSRDSMLTGTPLRRAATPARYGSSAPRPSSTGSTAATFSCAR